jgi:hypothetical protein
MELALHLGMTTQTLGDSMLASELDQWANYASRYPLPYKRIEILLAQISLLIAKTMGGAKNVTVRDFMLREPEDMPSNVTRIEAARKAFGFNPRKVKG